MVYRDKQALDFLSISDQLRTSAGSTVQRLRKLGINEIGILSGDHDKSVQLEGKKVSISRLWSGLEPDDKMRIIQEVQRENSKVIFVGEGINDAPAFAVADTGIAMGEAKAPK